MKIVFENLDKTVSVLTPTLDALSFATIEQIAEKDVPVNLPYWILEVSNIPSDRTYREAWRIEPIWGDPSGFGGESNDFDAALLESYNVNR